MIYLLGGANMKKLIITVLVALLSLIIWLAIPKTSVSQVAEIERPYKEILAQVTAYTSSPEETDDTPFITASGSFVDETTLACPAFLPFGTKVEIEGKMFVCKDRMNQRYRYDHYYDMWVQTKEEARDWGRQTVAIRIYE